MKRLLTPLLLAGTIIGGSACSRLQLEKVPKLDSQSAAIVEQLGQDEETMARLVATPLYEMNEEEVGQYIAFAQERYLDLRERIVHIGRKNIGQPYDIFLLGELPFESHDPAPMYSLTHSDCVVFSEHTYAMALTDDWPSFFRMLQRIRYEEGQIGVVTRNHYTEADWNRNNSWLVEDITAQLGGENAREFTQTIKRQSFFDKRYDLQVSIPDETIEEVYIPTKYVSEIESQLQPGDFVNVIRGPNADSVYAGHTGLIAHGEDGTINLLHSTTPHVKEEPLSVYIEKHHKRDARKEEGEAVLQGFKFLRLRENPVENLRAIDGDQTPRFQPPANSEVTTTSGE